MDSVSDVVSITTVVSGMNVLVSVMEQVWNVMTSNPLLVVFLGGSLLSVGIKIFRKIKGAAKG